MPQGGTSQRRRNSSGGSSRDRRRDGATEGGPDRRPGSSGDERTGDSRSPLLRRRDRDTDLDSRPTSASSIRLDMSGGDSDYYDRVPLARYGSNESMEDIGRDIPVRRIIPVSDSKIQKRAKELRQLEKQFSNLEGLFIDHENSRRNRPNNQERVERKLALKHEMFLASKANKDALAEMSNSRLTPEQRGEIYTRLAQTNLNSIKKILNYATWLASHNDAQALGLSYRLGKEIQNILDGNADYMREVKSINDGIELSTGKAERAGKIAGKVFDGVDQVQNAAGGISGAGSVVAGAATWLEGPGSSAVLAATNVTSGTIAGFGLGGSGALFGLIGLARAGKGKQTAEERLERIDRAKRVREKEDVEDGPFTSEAQKKLQRNLETHKKNMVAAGLGTLAGAVGIIATAGAATPLVGAMVGAAGAGIATYGSVSIADLMSKGDKAQGEKIVQGVKRTLESGTETEKKVIRQMAAGLALANNDPGTEVVRAMIKDVDGVPELPDKFILTGNMDKLLKEGDKWRTFLAKQLLQTYANGSVTDRISAAEFIATLNIDIQRADVEDPDKLVKKIKNALKG